MALEQKLSIRMSQRLVMTPSLQQAIKLLQMSKLELAEEIQQELLENPVLEESQLEASGPEKPEPEAEAEPEAAADTFDDIDYEAYFQNVDNDMPPPPRREVRDDLPSFEIDRTVTPCPHNPLGVKGAGEAGTIGSTPAVVNAVMDALSEKGIKHLEMPLTSEKVWRALHS